MSTPIPFFPFPTSSVSVAAGGIAPASVQAGAFAGQIVRSVQHHIITIGVGQASASVALNPAIVNPARVALFHCGQMNNSTDAAGGTAYAYLNPAPPATPTAVSASRSISTGSNVTSVCVVEFF
jgi:hypothetical protein